MSSFSASLLSLFRPALILSVTLTLTVALASGCGSSDNPGTDAATVDTGGGGDGGAVTGDPTRGMNYVAQRKCAMCHTGTAGLMAGADLPRPSTMAYPANITPDPDTGIGSWTDDLIIDAMRVGTDDEDAQLCPETATGKGDGMPRFTDMSDAEAADIVAYLRSIPAINHAVAESACSPIK
jgi:mono/diheme cytochrome c family protein